MNALEASAALKILEEAVRLLWKVSSRLLAAVFGVTGTALLQVWLVVRLFPAVV